jgi:DnaJ-domain-containing protein 1
MDPFWLTDEASFAGVMEAQRGAVEPSSRAGTGAPFLTQIEQVLGEEAEPDAAFFIDSWTVGVAAASENYLRRQEALKRPEPEFLGLDNFFSFTPFFVARVEVSAEAAWPLPKTRVVDGLMVDPRWPGDEEVDDPQAANEVEMICPLTLESACKVLGVAVTSTREQIRAAYRKMASRYHPDRQVRGGAREQKLASDRMASINEAYRLLRAELAERWSTC